MDLPSMSHKTTIFKSLFKCSIGDVQKYFLKPDSEKNINFE
jgi:hypothetical protein